MPMGPMSFGPWNCGEFMCFMNFDGNRTIFEDALSRQMVLTLKHRSGRVFFRLEAQSQLSVSGVQPWPDGFLCFQLFDHTNC